MCKALGHQQALEGVSTTGLILCITVPTKNLKHIYSFHCMVVDGSSLDFLAFMDTMLAYDCSNTSKQILVNIG